MEVSETIDHLFRREYAKLVACLTAKFGASQLDLVEDAVQEALLRATQLWAYQAEPRNSSAWLYRVARNYLIDQLRRQERSRDLTSSRLEPSDQIPEDLLKGDLPDEQLKMLFACCHPGLSPSEQVMLSLKFLCGLGTREIATSLVKKEPAVKRSLTRAKQRFKTKVGKLIVPGGLELKKRLDIVTKVIYLMFNEGYKATRGGHLMKKNICDEAIRLAVSLRHHRHCNTPDVNALLALMCFNASRFDARLGEEGELLTLENQDRLRWNQETIGWGLYFLARSGNGLYLSEYHLEAAIASLYSTAKSFEETDWKAILSLYDLLSGVNGSPMVALNRLVVLAKVKGATSALAEIDQLEPQLSNHYLFHSIRADLLASAGQTPRALGSLRQAIRLAGNRVERRFLEGKLEQLSLPPPPRGQTAFAGQQ